MSNILTHAEIDALARAANDRMEKDLDIIKRQTAEIERLKTKPLWAELEAALREAADALTMEGGYGPLIDRLHALAASPEAAPRLPGAVLQANSDGTISKVDPDPLTAQDKSSMIQWLREMADKLEGE
jgi:hypothetical protein